MSTDHVWVAPLAFALSERDARHVARRKQIEIQTRAKLTPTHESFCFLCGVSPERSSTECAAKVDRASIIGGDLSVRKRRKTSEAIGTLVPMPPLNRRVDSLPYVPRPSSSDRINGGPPQLRCRRVAIRRAAHSWVLEACVPAVLVARGADLDEPSRAAASVENVSCLNCGTTSVFREVLCVVPPAASPLGRQVSRLAGLTYSESDALTSLPSTVERLRVSAV